MLNNQNLFTFASFVSNQLSDDELTVFISHLLSSLFTRKTLSSHSFDFTSSFSPSDFSSILSFLFSKLSNPDFLRQALVFHSSIIPLDDFDIEEFISDSDIVNF